MENRAVIPISPAGIPRRPIFHWGNSFGLATTPERKTAESTVTLNAVVSLSDRPQGASKVFSSSIVKDQVALFELCGSEGFVAQIAIVIGF